MSRLLIADAARPVQAQAGLTPPPDYSFHDRPAIRRLHEFVRSLKGDRIEASGFGKVPIDRLAEIAPACRISRARVVDAGRIVTAGGIASGMELGFHLRRRRRDSASDQQ